jgi:hypothetical protein
MYLLIHGAILMSQPDSAGFRLSPSNLGFQGRQPRTFGVIDTAEATRAHPLIKMQTTTLNLSWEGRGGKLSKGDVIDVILLRQINGDERAQLIVEHVEVLAVEQQSLWKAKVTIGATRSQIRKLATARQHGTLTLMLSSPQCPTSGCFGRE